MIRGIRPIENPWTEAGPAGPAQQGRSGIEAKPRRKAGARKRTGSRTRSRTSNASGARDERWFHAAATVTLAVFGLSIALTIPPPGRSTAPEPEPEPVAWAPSRPGDTLKRGAALSQILAARGLDPAEIEEIVRLLRGYRSPRSLRSGTLLRFAFAPIDSASDAVPSHIGLELTPDSMLHFVRADSVWTARMDVVPFVMDTVRISALVESSLWSARLGGDVSRLGKGGFEDLVYDLADVFAWKVDFTRDLRRGDVLRVALERKVRPDGSVRSRHFLAIELRNQDRVFRAIPQPRPGGRWTYFDEDGRSLHGAFLRYPVPYRITSRFTRRRYHPILRRYRSHEGIDYGAPPGTPVEATASGVVARAGYAGGYGRVVELRHAQGIRTRYAHLSAIGAGIRPGARVEQGTVIGRVGSSGLATGPHLHYEFIMNGRHRDPLTVELPGRPALATSRLAEFRRTRDHALPLLQGIPVPLDPSVALAERSARRRLHPRRG